MLAQSVAIGSMMTTGDTPWLAVGLAALVACGSAVGWRRVRGTTLAAPAAWCVVAALVIAAAEAYLAWKGSAVAPLSASLLRYAAAAGVFCPATAVLGAKRPQDRGWQWVVAALWAILLAPAVQAAAARSGDRLELFAAWQLMLAALAAMLLLNYLATRYALAACLAVAGQLGLLAPYWMGVSDSAGRWRTGGLALLLSAVIAAALLSRRPDGPPSGEALEDAHDMARRNRRWIAFRDGWGAFWALRILQRVNQSAELGAWPVRLGWSGFTPVEDATATAAPAPATLRRIDETLDALLWRFERQL